MTTTFAKYANTRRPNYCTLPTIDVEILPEIHHCAHCDAQVVYERGARLFGDWVHVDITIDHAKQATATPKAACRYCNAEDGVTFYHQAYSDETVCTRCGGVEGYPIGD